VCAQAGIKVTIIDKDDSILQKSMKAMDGSLSRVGKKRFADDVAAQAAFKKDTLARIQTATDLAKAVAAVDLVVEAVVENLELKRHLFAQVEVASKP
jgi:3-hydroxyacyl-CoA dehydrogenase